jgi:hypothetical protein
LIRGTIKPLLFVGSNLEEVDVAKKYDFQKPQKNGNLRPKYFYGRPSWVNLTRWGNIETSMESMNQVEFDCSQKNEG